MDDAKPVTAKAKIIKPEPIKSEPIATAEIPPAPHASADLHPSRGVELMAAVERQKKSNA